MEGVRREGGKRRREPDRKEDRWDRDDEKKGLEGKGETAKAGEAVCQYGIKKGTSCGLLGEEISVHETLQRETENFAEKHKRVKIHVRACSTQIGNGKVVILFSTALLCSLVTVEYCECSVCGQEQAR